MENIWNSCQATIKKDVDDDERLGAVTQQQKIRTTDAW
jgi:hypothetical protein